MRAIIFWSLETALFGMLLKADYSYETKVQTVKETTVVEHANSVKLVAECFIPTYILYIFNIYLI